MESMVVACGAELDADKVSKAPSWVGFPLHSAVTPAGSGEVIAKATGEVNP
jgi:hypothetical protein